MCMTLNISQYILSFSLLSVIIIMPESVVTDIGKIKPTEEVHLYSKSSVLAINICFLAYKLMEKLIDIMEDDDDVQNIWHNWEE